MTQLAMDQSAGTKNVTTDPDIRPGLHATWVRTGRWTEGSDSSHERPPDPDRTRRRMLVVILLTSFLWAAGPPVVDLFLGGRTLAEHSTGAVAPTPWGNRLDSLVNLLCPIALLVVTLRNTRRRHVNSAALLAALIPWAVIRSLEVVHHGGLSTSGLILQVPVLAVAIWSLNIQWPDLKVIGQLTAILAFGSLAMAATMDVAWMLPEQLGVTGDTKGLVTERVLAGPFAQMNLLGMSLALGFPFLFMLDRKALRWASVAAALATMTLASSRTALLGLGIATLVMLAMAATRSIAAKRTTFSVAAGVIAGTTVLLPLYVDDPQALTRRGDMWIEARRLVQESWLVGIGPDAYGPTGDVTRFLSAPASHGHNLFISNLSLGGIALVLAVSVLLVTAFRHSLDLIGRSWYPAMTVITMLSIGIAEMPIRFDEFDGVSWVAWPTLLCIVLFDRQSTPTTDRAAVGQDPAHPSHRGPASAQTPASGA